MLRRALWALSLCLLSPAFSLAQLGQFLRASQYTVGASPLAAAAGDFNGDGIPDLAVVNKADGTVSVLIGNGNGTFQPQVVYELNAVPATVAVGNLDNNDYLDIVVTLPFQSDGDTPRNQVAVLRGNGDGTFQSPYYFNTGSLPQFVAVQDLNGDGWPDLVVANGGASNISVLINKGNGAGFWPHVEYATGNAPLAVAIADFNTDGRPDLAVANSCGSDPTCKSAGTVSILLGNGDGTFQAQTTYDVGYQPRAITAADFNGDGKVDLAIGNFDDSTVSILTGNGNGTFQSQVTYATAPWEPYGIIAADFNGDGKIDLAVANAGGDSVSILINDGTGKFPAHVDYWAGNGAGIMVAADFNGDSKIDLAVPDLGWAARADNKLTVLLGNGDGTFRSNILYPVGDTPMAVAGADFNGDGKLDLVLVNAVDNTVSVLLGNGDGTYQPQVSYSVGQKPLAVAVGDFNKDGKVDIAVANSLDNTVGVLLGNGDGTFQGQVTYAVGTTPAALAVADFNKDGNPDLVVANSGDGTVQVLLGDGNGGFQPQAAFSVGDHATALAIGDLNGDALADLVVVLPNLNEVATFLGKGDGTFNPPSEYATGNKPASVAIGDLNSDGKLDVVVANSADNTVSVLLGNGDGTLQSQKAYPAGQGPSAVIIGDFNGDGKLDVLAANQQDNSASLFLSKGDGTFQSPSTYGLGWLPVALAAVDVNGDGALDVVSADSGVRSASVLINSQGTFLTLDSDPKNTNYGQTITLTSTVVASVNWEPAPTGSVEFLDGSDSLGSAPLVSGTATLPVSTLTAGNHTLSARYLGDSNFQPHTGASITQNVNAATTSTSLGSSPNPSWTDQPVTFTATVAPQYSGIPTGSVAFYDGTTKLGTGTLAGGSALLTTSALTVGSHSITASYGGDSNFTGSTSPELTQVVNGRDFSLSASPLSGPVIVGQSGTSTVTLTAINGFDSVVDLSCSAGLPKGATCSFDPPSVTPTANGATSMLTINTGLNTPAGVYAVSVTGTSATVSHTDPNLALSVIDFTITGPDLTSPSSIAPGQSATASVVVTSLNGFANSVLLSCAGLPGGASCSFNPPSVIPTATGASSVLTIAIAANTPAGSYTISVAGTWETLARAYSALGFRVGDFKVSAPASTTPGTISAGQSAAATISWASLDGFANPVSLTCSVAPNPGLAPTCTLAPSSLTPSPGGTTSTLTVNTTAATAAVVQPALRHDMRPLYALWLLVPGFVFMGVVGGTDRSRKRKLLAFVCAGLLLIGLTTQIACGGGATSGAGGGNGTPGTPSGNYVVTVTGTSGSGTAALTHKVTVTVTVQ